MLHNTILWSIGAYCFVQICTCCKLSTVPKRRSKQPKCWTVFEELVMSHTWIICDTTKLEGRWGAERKEAKDISYHFRWPCNLISSFCLMIISKKIGDEMATRSRTSHTSLVTCTNKRLMFLRAKHWWRVDSKCRPALQGGSRLQGVVEGYGNLVLYALSSVWKLWRLVLFTFLL